MLSKIVQKKAYMLVLSGMFFIAPVAYALRWPGQPTVTTRVFNVIENHSEIRWALAYAIGGAPIGIGYLVKEVIIGGAERVLDAVGHRADAVVDGTTHRLWNFALYPFTTYAKISAVLTGSAALYGLRQWINAKIHQKQEESDKKQRELEELLKRVDQHIKETQASRDAQQGASASENV